MVKNVVDIILFEKGRVGSFYIAGNYGHVMLCNVYSTMARISICALLMEEFLWLQLFIKTLQIMFNFWLSMARKLTMHDVTNYCCKSLEKCVDTVTVRLIFLSFKKNVYPSNILGIRFFCFCCLVFCFVLFFWFWILVFFGVFWCSYFFNFIFHNLYCYSKTDRQITTFSRTLKNTSWCHVLMYIYIYRYTKYTHKFSPEKKKKNNSTTYYIL